MSVVFRSPPVPVSLMQRLGVRKRLRKTEVIDTRSKIVGDSSPRTPARSGYGKEFSTWTAPRALTQEVAEAEIAEHPLQS